MGGFGFSYLSHSLTPLPLPSTELYRRTSHDRRYLRLDVTTWKVAGEGLRTYSDDRVPGLTARQGGGLRRVTISQVRHGRRSSVASP